MSPNGRSDESQTLPSTEGQTRQSPHPSPHLSPRQLLDLPGEVLHLICAQLCHHCRSRTLGGSSERPMDAVEDWTSYCKDSLALHALSQTCTVLRDAAQALLYHFPRIKSHHCFLRTVRERPDLADHVKHVWPVRVSLDELAKDMAPDGFALVKKTASELQMLVPGTDDTPFEDEFSVLLAHLASRLDDHQDGPQDEPEHDCFFQRDIFQTLLQGMLMALLPRLEVMHVDCWNDDNRFPPEIYHHAKRRLRRTGRMVSDGNGMGSLRTVVVRNWRLHTYRWERDDLMARDAPDGVFDGVHLDPHEFLLTCAASSLRQLIFRYLDAPHTWPATSRGPNPTKTLWSALPHLRAVEFQQMAWGVCRVHPESGMDSLPEEQLEAAYAGMEQMARECASLRSFSVSVVPFDGTGPNSFSPRRLLQSLLPAAERLEAICVQPYGIALRPFTELLVGGADLHCFTRLQELSLLEDCFCRGWTLDDDYDPDDDDFLGSLPGEDSDGKEADEKEEEHPYACTSTMCLVDMVPQSVTSLTVRLRGQPRAIPDIVRLGQEAAQGRFPSLRRVAVEFYEHNGIPGLEEAFHGSGVFVEVVSHFE